MLKQLFLEKSCANTYPFKLFLLIEMILCDFLGLVEFMLHTSTLLSSFQCCLWFIHISLRFYNSYGLNFVQSRGLHTLGTIPEFRRSRVAFLYDFEPL